MVDAALRWLEDDAVGGGGTRGRGSAGDAERQNAKNSVYIMQCLSAVTYNEHARQAHGVHLSSNCVDANTVQRPQLCIRLLATCIRPAFAERRCRK